MGHAIDFDSLKEVSYLGIRRAAAFLGLGLNAARREDFTDYQLTKDATFRVLPADLPPEKVADIKDAFGKWVIACGLRELTETFAVYLDGIYRACMLMAVTKPLVLPVDATKSIRKFLRLGLAEKLIELRSRFGVATPKEAYLGSINRARNCITHRRGIVGHEDLTEGDMLRLKWWAVDLFVQTPSGERISLKPPLPGQGILLKDGGSVMLGVVDREREFSRGTVLEMTANDLMEVCMVVQFATDEILGPSSTVGSEKRSESDIRIYEKQGDMRRGIGVKLKT